MLTTFDQTQQQENLIYDVEFKHLTTFPDQRGFFRELIRITDGFFCEGFGQWSHSKMTKNTVKAWHFHHLQIDWWYVPLGVIETVLFDLREESPTYKKKIRFKLGDAESDLEALVCIVKIPPGVLHGCKTLSNVAHLFYITSETYNPDDEGRYPFDSEIVPHSWGDEESIVTVERDRTHFSPKNPRRVLGV